MDLERSLSGMGQRRRTVALPLFWLQSVDEAYRSALKTVGVYFVLGPNDGFDKIHPALTTILQPTACVPSQWREMVTNASNCVSLNCRCHRCNGFRFHT